MFEDIFTFSLLITKYSIFLMESAILWTSTSLCSIHIFLVPMCFFFGKSDEYHFYITIFSPKHFQIFSLILSLVFKNYIDFFFHFDQVIHIFFSNCWWLFVIVSFLYLKICEIIHIYWLFSYGFILLLKSWYFQSSILT